LVIILNFYEMVKRFDSTTVFSLFTFFTPGKRSPSV